MCTLGSLRSLVIATFFPLHFSCQYRIPPVCWSVCRLRVCTVAGLTLSSVCLNVCLWVIDWSLKRTFRMWLVHNKLCSVDSFLTSQSTEPPPILSHICSHPGLFHNLLWILFIIIEPKRKKKTQDLNSWPSLFAWLILSSNFSWEPRFYNHVI